MPSGVAAVMLLRIRITVSRILAIRLEAWNRHGHAKHVIIARGNVLMYSDHVIYSNAQILDHRGPLTFRSSRACPWNRTPQMFANAFNAKVCFSAITHGRSRIRAVDESLTLISAASFFVLGSILETY